MDASRQLGPSLKRVIDPMLKTDADKVLLLSCIDLRYPHRITDTMDAQGYRGKYYHLAMAGASHAARHSCEWKKSVEDHLQFAIDHAITGVVILDHMDCAAYVLYEHVQPNSPEERQRHRDNIKAVAAEFVALHSRLEDKVKGFILEKEVDPPIPEEVDIP